jgi:hypothetical protein
MRSVRVLALLGLLSCQGEIVAPPAGVPGSAGSAGESLQPPPRAGFAAVADALQPSCGTLDCHGQIGRNLRLFGARGMRLDPRDTSAEGTTKPAEYEATYWSMVGLEPEEMSGVVRDRGAGSDRLALIRKARGVDLHKGGVRMKLNDDLDRCLLSWLAGSISQPACEAAVHVLDRATP